VIPPLKNNDEFLASVSTNYQCAIPKSANSNTFKIALKSPTLEIAVNWDTLYSLNYPGFGTINWYLNGSKVGVGQKIRATKVGRYNAILSWQGCNGDSSNALVLNSVDYEPIKNTLVKIYPNPSKGNVFVESDSKLKSIKLFSSDGQLIEFMESKDLDNLATKAINGSENLYELHLPSGMYFIEIETKESFQINRVFEKIIVK
jgi:hypothetical protein